MSARQLCTGRRAYLIIDNGKAIAFLSQTQYCFCEIIPRAQRKPSSCERSDSCNPSRYGLPRLPAWLYRIHLNGSDRIRFIRWPVTAAVKHVIGRVMNQPGAQLCGFRASAAGARALMIADTLRLAFRLVHSCIGSRHSRSHRERLPERLAQFRPGA